MSWETALDRQIHDYLPDLKWAADEPMAKHTSFRIGLSLIHISEPTRP